MDSIADDVVIVESGVWVDFFRGLRTPETEWILAEAGERLIGTLDLIICEVLQGVPREPEYRKIRRKMLELPAYNSGGAEIAVESAQNYRKLRAKGITIRKTIDCIIATCCIRHGFALLHKDRDFDPFETHLGLHVIHPNRENIQ